jgi:hypothetical protein
MDRENPELVRYACLFSDTREKRRLCHKKNFLGTYLGSRRKGRGRSDKGDKERGKLHHGGCTNRKSAILGSELQSTWFELNLL